MSAAPIGPSLRPDVRANAGASANRTEMDGGRL